MPDRVICDTVDTLRSEVEALRQERDTLIAAVASQDERERLAGEKCGVPYAGCNWPDAVADEVLRLRMPNDDTEILDWLLNHLDMLDLNFALDGAADPKMYGAVDRRAVRYAIAKEQAR